MRRFVAAAGLLTMLTGACSDSEPSSRAQDDPSVTPIPTVPIVTTTSITFPVATTSTTTTLAAPTTTAPRLVEDLEDGDHVGYVASVEADTIAFDRVEPVDADGDGTPESVVNDNPRVRAVPLPASVTLDGSPVDPATAAQQLGGGGALIRITVQGQQLVAIQQVTLAPAPPPPPSG